MDEEKFDLTGLEDMCRRTLGERGRKSAWSMLKANLILLEQDRQRGMSEEEYRATGDELARIYHALFADEPLP